VIVFFVFSLSPAPVVDALKNLVISRPNGKCRIVSRSPDLLLDFLLNVQEEFLS